MLIPNKRPHWNDSSYLLRESNRRQIYQPHFISMIILITARINHHISSKVQNEITYPFPNC